MIFIGIDPGLNGALVALRQSRDGRVSVAQIKCTPTLVVKPHRREYDVLGMIEAVRELAKSPFESDSVGMCVIEKQQPFPGSLRGGISAFRSGVGYGLWLGILAACELPHRPVLPRTWQKKMLADVARGKAGSILMAKRLFPKVSLRRNERSRIDNDGISDALLMAEYARLSYTGSVS